jgi:nucleoside-diphosphate-sugar epimerase
MRLVVTGSSGFLGSATVAYLARAGHEVLALDSPRAPKSAPEPGVTRTRVDLLKVADFAPMLEGYDAVLHIAGRAHVTRGGPEDSAATFRPLNVDVTARLAEGATKAGVGRFVFVSSISVNGDRPAAPITELDAPAPSSHYGRSKLAAERAVCAQESLPWVIVRPPLIVGPGATGSLGALLKLLETGLPLPFASLNNRRNIAGLDNLIAFLELCCIHPKAMKEVFLYADQPALSTADLVRILSKAQQRKVLLVPVPAKVIAIGARLIGRGSALGGLWQSLEMDMAKARGLLGWSQPHPVDYSIREAAVGP